MSTDLKNTMIERIVARYIALNEQDYANGYLDKSVKDNCNEYARAFGNTLQNLSDECVSKFYRLDRNIQNKVFAYDSACWSASVMSPFFVQNCLEITRSDMKKYGLDKIDCVVEIMTPHFKNLENMLNAEFHDLGNGVIAYTGLNGARI